MHAIARDRRPLHRLPGPARREAAAILPAGPASMQQGLSPSETAFPAIRDVITGSTGSA